MLEFNPSIFKYNNKFYMLLREETKNDIYFNESIFSYSLCEINDNFEILKRNKCSIKNNGIEYKEILRSKCNYTFIIPEDIKILPNLVNNKLIGLSNILYDSNIYKMCIGLIELDVYNYNINVIKIYNTNYLVDKNWSYIYHNDTHYIIYSIYPYLIIYTLDESTYNIKLYQKTYTFDSIKYVLDYTNIHNNYKYLYLTLCSFPIKFCENKYLLFLKKRCENNDYEYYESYLFIENNKFKIIFNNDIILKENMLYLNDVKDIDNKIIMCFGKNDEKFNIAEYYFNKNKIFTNIW